jgi:hypothetical protein
MNWQQTILSDLCTIAPPRYRNENSRKGLVLAKGSWAYCRQLGTWRFGKENVVFLWCPRILSRVGSANPIASESSGKAKDARCFSTAQNSTLRIDRPQNGGSFERIGL